MFVDAKQAVADLVQAECAMGLWAVLRMMMTAKLGNYARYNLS